MDMSSLSAGACCGSHEDGWAAERACRQNDLLRRENFAIDDLHADRTLVFNNDRVDLSVTADPKSGRVRTAAVRVIVPWGTLQ
jgi:hypothetical protein